VLVGSLLAILGVVIILWYMEYMESNIVNILAAFLSLTASVATLLISVLSRNQPPILDLDKQLDHATEELAYAVAQQWQTDMAIRESRHPFPLLVRWSTADCAMTDHPGTTLGTKIFNVEESSNRQFSFSGRLDQVTETFNQLPKRRLVVLGRPGSGKTVLARHLTLGLLAQRQPGQLVPALLPIVSWDPTQQPLHDWITSRLTDSYPGLGTTVAKSSLAWELVHRGLVLPILDGLDELPESVRSAAINALNRSLASDDPLVLTCRSAEYAAVVKTYDVLTAAAVVELEPLLPTDIKPYLEAATPPSQGGKWDRIFTRLDEDPSGPLAAALSTPLMASLVRAIYANHPADPTELLDANRFSDRHSIEDYLLDQFIPALYRDRPPLADFSPLWHREDVQRWLSFLARHSDRLHTRDLAWWQLTTAIPSVVALLFRLLLGLAVGLFFGLAVGLSFGLIYGLSSGLASGLAVGLTYGLAVGLTYGRSKSPAKVETRIRGQFWKSSMFLVAGGLVFGLAGGLVFGLAGGLVYGLVGGLAVGLLVGFTTPADIARAVSPRSVLQRDKAAAFMNGLVSGVASVLMLALTFVLTFELASGLTFGLIVGLASGLVGVTASAWFHFFLARGWFAIRGQLPWRLMTFLDDAYHRGVLRQTGAVYQFRNARLQDRLAKWPVLTPIVDDGPITEDERNVLYAKLEERLAEDTTLAEQFRVEKVDRQDVGMRARELLKDYDADLIPFYRSLRKSLQRRNEYASRSHKENRRELVVNRLSGAIVLTSVVIIVITVLLFGLPYQSLLVVLGVPLTAVIVLRASISREKAANRQHIKSEVVDAAVAYDRAEVDFQDQVYHLIIAPAIHKAARPNFAEPVDEFVGLTEARGLAARIESSSRVETRSFHRIGVYLRRSGGSTVGLAGARGVGKTELLRWFCDADTASIEKGGTVGVLVAAPVAYEPQTFLRMLIRRLCAEVPGYQERAVTHPLATRTWAQRAIRAVIVTTIVAGVVIVSGLRPPAGKALGWELIGVGCVTLFGLLVWGKTSEKTRAWWNARPRMLGGHKYDVSQASLKRRKDAAWYAENTARRVRFAEKYTAGGEASLSWAKISTKLTSATELSALPLTEADLVGELTQLVKELKDSGYNIVIGIDELDKLDADDSAERFLNSIKILFPIRGCSFLVSISKNAWTRFVHRGLPIRDVFDSSLDTVILVEHLTYAEARSFILRRAESMTDTQVLFCYCLSGGLPRDLLRFARQLGETNSDLGPSQQLNTVIPIILGSELAMKVQGVLFALGSRESGRHSLEFVVKLEDLRETTGEAWTQMLSDFLTNDSEFAKFASRRQREREPLNLSQQVSADEWIVRTRRELFTYLNFLDTVRLAFASAGPISSLAHGDKDGLLGAFEELAQARRRIEVDASAGWRKLNEARRMLRLPPPGRGC
jgi:NACHT domain/KAP family P-loop domain